MRKMRSLNLPKITTTSGKAQKDEESPAMSSPYHFVPGHSRDSSAASSTSSPSTFSNPGHGRWPGSNSSLETTAESPVNVSKAPLHDLVEDPEERDDDLLNGSTTSADEPFCICDTTNCDHRRTITPSYSGYSPISPEWTHGDDQFNFSGLTEGPFFKRRKSGDASPSGNFRRHSRRWPSITKRWHDRKATTSVSSPSVRSAPPSRSSSLQSPSLRRSLASHLDPNDPFTPPATPARSRTTSITRPKPPPEPLDIKAAETADDPVDPSGQSSTPLLPPAMTSLRHLEEEEELQSPLQSPRVAPSSTVNTPLSSPASPQAITPNLSTKPSIASITMGHQRGLQSQDIPSMSISDEQDPWAAKLGHANFTINPQPYLPETFTNETCTVLLNDWELARSRYMRHATRITETYASTSKISKYTEQKWAEIDGLWRSNLEFANAEAEANGEVGAWQSLAETQAVSRIPTLEDPTGQPGKFPQVGEDGIVGPMVRYARAEEEKPAKKNGFLRLLTSPGSLLGGRRRPSV